MRRTLPLRRLCLYALLAALITVCAWVSIPAPIPFTLQTAAICLTASLLPISGSLIVLAVYVGLGVMGLPVFSGFVGGPGALFGATGGFIMGFFLTAAVIGIAVRWFGSKWYILALSMTAGIALCYITGTMWYMTVYATGGDAVSLSKALSVCVLPFLLPDALKIAAATVISLRLRPLVKRFF